MPKGLIALGTKSFKDRDKIKAKALWKDSLSRKEVKHKKEITDVPIYTFRCTNEECKEEVEMMGSIKHDYRLNPIPCPECGSMLVKLMDNPDFKFQRITNPLSIRNGGKDHIE